MPIGPRYPAAHEVAPKIHAHFAQMFAPAGASAGAHTPTLPSVADIETLIDVAFWASLRREETYLPRISLALVPPHLASNPMVFDEPLALGPRSLVRVGPAVERRGIHLGVWNHGGALRVWGTTRIIPPSAIVLEVSAPGLIVVKHHRGDGLKFMNVAVLEAERIKMVDHRASALPDCPALVTSLLGADSPAGPDMHLHVLVELAVSMRAHGRGGLMLMVPAGSDTWRESIVQPVIYAVNPTFTGLSALVERARVEQEQRDWQDELEDTVRAVAGLTAVDGATVITDRFELLSFGAKIARRRGSAPVEQTTVTEPIEGGQTIVVHPSHLGGTRHLSAAQFVHDQRDAVALVASQDGRFTIFAWSPCEDMVHAHRVEMLLL